MTRDRYALRAFKRRDRRLPIADAIDEVPRVREILRIAVAGRVLERFRARPLFAARAVEFETRAGRTADGAFAHLEGRIPAREREQAILRVGCLAVVLERKAA